MTPNREILKSKTVVWRVWQPYKESTKTWVVGDSIFYLKSDRCSTRK